MLDCLVIGAGPIGCSAALSARAEGMDVALVYCDQSSICHRPFPADCYGLTQKSGQELFEQGLAQARKAGVLVVQDEITGLAHLPTGICAKGKTDYVAKTLILAIGGQNHTLPTWARGKESFVQNGLSGVPKSLYRNRMVGIVGCGPYAMACAKELLEVAKAVTLFTDGKQSQLAEPGLLVNGYPIASLLGQQRLTGIVFENGISLNIDHLLLANRMADTAQLLQGLQTGQPITVQEDGTTNIPGVFVGLGDPASLASTIYRGYALGKQCSLYK